MGKNNLPVLHHSEAENTAVDILRERLNALDGYMSISNATVPQEAVDVGMDAPNPSGDDLGYGDNRVTVTPKGEDVEVMVGETEQEYIVGHGVMVSVENWA